MQSADIDLVIVNWNSGERLRTCLAAVAGSRAADRFHVIVVDNASEDGSADGLAAAPAALTLIRHGGNRGFGAACNAGASIGTAPVLLFLNPDTVVSVDAIAGAADFLRGDPAIGIVGARLTNGAGHTLRNTARHPTPRRLFGQALGLDRLVPSLVPPHFSTEWDHEETRAVDAVMGAFLMLRRDLFACLEGFDERFFVYFEDADLCLRVEQAGYAIVHWAGAPVQHEGGGTTHRVKDLRLFYFLRSKAMFVAKHFGRTAALRQLAVDLTLHIPIRFVRALTSGSPADAAASLRAGAMLVGALPHFLRGMRAGP